MGELVEARGPRRGMLLAVALGVVVVLCIVLVLVTRPAVLGGTGTEPADSGPCSAGSVDASAGSPGHLPAGVQDSVGDMADSAPVGREAVDADGVPPMSGEQPAFGVVTEGGFGSPAEWDDVARAVDESPSLIMAYASFVDPLPFAGLEAVAARGATPVLVWEPWDPTQGIEQSRFSLTTIVAGHHDPYIREWAGGLKAYGKPVILRFAHEMNFPWYPWGAGVNGNTPEQYVEAWRHVHGLFEAQGVDNVSWAWNPEAPECGSSLQPFWPGGDVVDLVALDAYNWGTDRPGERWQSPAELFGEGFSQLRDLAPGTPIIIGETGSSEAGGSKAAWLAELIRYLSEQPDVEAFIWFDLRKEEDWRITSSESSRVAFREALRERGEGSPGA